MYCSTCGTELAEGLSFCNRCGADLKPTETLISINKPKALPLIIALGIIMLTGLAIGGLATVFAALMEFFRLGFPINGLMMLGILSIVVIFGSVWVLGRQVSRLINLYLESGESARETKREKINKKLEARRPAEIDAVPIKPMMSVTENTTRTLDQIYRER